jgi:flagellar biosynthesis protein FliP
LKPFKKSSNAKVINDLENSLVELKNAIDNRSPPIQVMMIAHTKIHPDLQLAFNLKLKNKM